MLTFLLALTVMVPGTESPSRTVSAESLPPADPAFIQQNLAEVPPLPRWLPGDPIRLVPRRHAFDPVLAAHPPRPVNPVSPGDPLAGETWRPGQRTKALNGPDLDLGPAEGAQDFIGGFPPDTVGDVGIVYYIQATNGAQGASYNIFDKASGNLVAGPLSMSALSGVAGACRDNAAGDPIVLFDETAQRWLLSEFTAEGPNRLCVYVSQTADPVTGGWFSYAFQAPNFPDYPKYGVWSDAYYVTTNEGSGPAVYVLERAAMLLGQSARMQRFTLSGLSGFGFQALTPADLDGAQPPPAGAPGIVMRHRDDEVHQPGANDPGNDFLELYRVSVDWNNAANSSLTGPTNIAIADFDSDLCGTTGFQCFPQPGTSVTLDPLREVLMWRLQYRNLGAVETLVGNLTTDVSGTDRGGIRFFELRRTGGVQAPWTNFQEGTLAPGSDSDSRWMGSAATDASGNLALAYSVSSSSTFPGLRYTGRLSTDPVGALTAGEITIVDGGASQTDAERWGDYSALSVDPADGCRFWFTSEYTQTRLWSTRIAAFRFDECGSDGFTLNGTNLSQEVCTASGAADLDSVEVTVMGMGGFDSSVDLAFNPVLPAGFSGSIVPSSISSGQTATVAVSVEPAAGSGTRQLSIEGTAPSFEPRSVAVNVNVTAGVPEPVTPVAPADGAVDVLFQPTFSWSEAAGAEHYRFELATDSGFQGLVEDRTLNGTSVQSAGQLSEGTRYFWRVTAQNSCGPGATSPVFSFTTAVSAGECPSGHVEMAVFSDDMETGAPDWLSSPEWSLQSGVGSSGSLAWKVEQVEFSGFYSLASPFILLPADANLLRLRFANRRNIEPGDLTGECFDGGILEYTTDDLNFFQLPAETFEVDPYNGLVSSDFGNPIEGSDAWCGDSSDFVETQVDVSALGGVELSFYWTLAADQSRGTPDTWIVDDVELIACVAGGGADVIFASGFEAGEVTAKRTRDRVLPEDRRPPRPGRGPVPAGDRSLPP